MQIKSIATKGEVVTTDNLSSFVMDCWTDSDYLDAEGNTVTDHHYISSQTVTKSSSTWSLGTHYWLDGVNLRFWSYAPATNLKKISQKGGQSTMSFTYNNTDANTDLIFAYNSQCCKYTDSGSLISGKETVPIKFEHALAQVRFAVCVSDLSFDKDAFEIVSMKLGGLTGYGTCVFDGEAKSFTWAAAGTATPKSYSQNINADFSSTIPSGWEEQTYSGKTYYVHTSDVLFMMPQTTTSATTIELTLKRKSDSSTFTKTATLSGEVWEAGKYYTYQINYTDIHFDITVLNDDYDPYIFDKTNE